MNLAPILCSDDGSGFQSCHFIGGCRPTGELCRADWECCNEPANGGAGVCEPIVPGEELGRCTNPTGCAPAGELCGPGYHICCACDIPENSPGCPNPDGDAFCQETIFGVHRCFSENCALEGNDCLLDEDCCGGICVDGVCGEGETCIENEQPCAFSDQCCCGVCAPGDNGLVCCPGGEECVPDEGLCTTDLDCCSDNCNSLGICGPEEDDCIPTGGVCELNEDCCSGTCTDGNCGGIILNK